MKMTEIEKLRAENKALWKLIPDEIIKEHLEHRKKLRVIAEKMDMNVTLRYCPIEEAIR